MPIGTLTVNVTHSFKWEIPNFLQRAESNGQGSLSPKFSVTDLKNRSGDCALRIYPKGENEECSEYVSIYLENLSEELLTISFSISILDSTGMKREESISKSRKYRPKKREWGFEDFLKIELLDSNSDLLNINDTLNLQLDIIKPGQGLAVSSLSDDLYKSFLNKNFSDIKVLCNNEKFDCHRVLLAARSPVFEVMLLGDFKECASREINLDHMEPEIVKEMLTYIHCGKMGNMKDNALPLLKVADQYQIDSLKEICGFHLSDNLSLENVLEYLILADIHKEEYLKNAAIDFAVKNFKKLMKTIKWEEEIKKYPDLLMEITIAIFQIKS